MCRLNRHHCFNVLYAFIVFRDPTNRDYALPFYIFYVTRSIYIHLFIFSLCLTLSGRSLSRSFLRGCAYLRLTILLIILGAQQYKQEQVVAYTEKSQVKHETRHIQLVREYGFHPRTKASVSDGGLLPRKFEPFPEDMYGRPLEEIDTFIYEEVRWWFVECLSIILVTYIQCLCLFPSRIEFVFPTVCFMFYAFIMKLMRIFFFSLLFSSHLSIPLVSAFSFSLSPFLSPIHIGWILLPIAAHHSDILCGIETLSKELHS